MKREKLEKIIKRFEKKIEKDCKKYDCPNCKIRFKNDDNTLDCPLTYTAASKELIIKHNKIDKDGNK